MISKFLQILGHQPQITKVFLKTLEQFVLTVGQNNFCNKIPFFCMYLPYLHPLDVTYAIWIVLSKHIYAVRVANRIQLPILQLRIQIITNFLTKVCKFCKFYKSSLFVFVRNNLIVQKVRKYSGFIVLELVDGSGESSYSTPFFCFFIP